MYSEKSAVFNHETTLKATDSDPRPETKYLAEGKGSIVSAQEEKDTNESYFAAFFLVGFVFEGLAFAVFFAALASEISANTFSIRRI